MCFPTIVRLTLATAVLACACTSTSYAPIAGTGGSGGSGGSGGGGEDFPLTPFVVGDVPDNAAELFGPAGTGDAGGPCLVEPPPGAVVPRNWSAPVFELGASDLDLFEVRFQAEDRAHELVVYADAKAWTLPDEAWALVKRAGSLRVTVRGLRMGGVGTLATPVLGTSGFLTVAPVDAPGRIVFWSAENDGTLLEARPGQAETVELLKPSRVSVPTVGGAAVSCFGCHAGTPDGAGIGVTAQSSGGNGNLVVSTEASSLGAAPSYMGVGAAAALQQLSSLGIQAYSPAHFKTGDRMMLASSLEGAAAQLVWVDLESAIPGDGSSWGVVARNGDARGAGAPAWSHDGATIAYVSTNGVSGGLLVGSTSDVYTVPYNARQGGLATPLDGAASSDFDEVHPTFSSNDGLVAFERVPAGTNPYNAGTAELFVVPASGGKAVRLDANDPPTCAETPSPGITNSWPRFAPTSPKDGGRTYHFLTFSSRRGSEHGRIYMTPVVQEGGEIRTYPAVLVPGQPDVENHTPTWF